MKHYDVLISIKAYEDMEAIYQYIAKTLLEPIIAAKQYNRIVEAILTLEKMPERIRLMYSEPERSKGLRPLIVDNYTIFFVIRDEIVYIVRILYSASNISKRLSEKYPLTS
jgi:plasmid stabilization system protein ParE